MLKGKEYSIFFSNLKSSVSKLKSQNIDFQAELINLKHRIAELEVQNAKYHTKQNKTDTKINEEIHRKITKLVQEVEECIRILEK